MSYYLAIPHLGLAHQKCTRVFTKKKKTRKKNVHSGTYISPNLEAGHPRSRRVSDRTNPLLPHATTRQDLAKSSPSDPTYVRTKAGRASPDGCLRGRGATAGGTRPARGGCTCLSHWAPAARASSLRENFPSCTRKHGALFYVHVTLQKQVTYKTKTKTCM